MAKNDMNAMLKRRMAATQQASELQASDEAYQQIFQRAPPLAPSEIADYDAGSQSAFAEMCSIEGYQINKATMQYIVRKCQPPTAQRHRIFAAWREARAEEEKRLMSPPKKISFDRKKFAPYLDKLGSDKEIEELFLQFLRERAG